MGVIGGVATVIDGIAAGLLGGSVPLCFNACGDRDLRMEFVGAEGIAESVPEL